MARILKFLLLYLSIIVCNHCASAQDAQIAELERFIEQTRQQWRVPGLAVAIVHDGQTVLCQGFGERELGSEQPVDQDTLFAIASNTKAFTSAALAMLVDAGKLQWDDPVSKTLPWLKLSDPLATSDLRVRDLLCHRSGLGTFSGDAIWWSTEYSTREVLQKISHLQLATPFRSKYGYSNLMYLAAGQVIEEASGQPYAKYIKQEILDPIGMDRTIISVRDLVSAGNFATPHKTYLDRSEPIAWMNWDSMAPGGGIISSVADMSKWLSVQLSAGELSGAEQESRLFSKQQAHEMWQAQTPIPVSESYSVRYPTTHFRAYGLGWVLADYHGRKTVGHGGGYDGMYSQVMLVPEEKLGIVVLTNSMTSIATPICYTIVDRFLGLDSQDWSTPALENFRKEREAFDKRIQAAITSSIDQTQPDAIGRAPGHSLKDYTGPYQCPMYGDVVIDQEGERLVLRMIPSDQLVADLEHLHYDTFVVRWRKNFAWFEAGTANFVSNAKGTVTKLELDIPNDDIFFHELSLTRASSKN